MNHAYKAGTNNRVIISLHGTGGDATQLFEISRYIDPNATLIGIEGDVKEEGMTRYFERYEDGSFNYKSVARATALVYETIQGLLNQYKLKNHELILMGYSNGANVIQSILKSYQTKYARIVLLHPSYIKDAQPFKAQAGIILATSGARDPYTSPEAFQRITGEIAAVNTIETYKHPHNHQITNDEIEAVKQFILSNH